MTDVEEDLLAFRYRATISSGYVRRDGRWQMMFHQQAPLPSE